METFVHLIFLSFLLVFCAAPAALLLADRFSDRVHAWLAKRIRKARRDLAAWLLAPEGLTVRPLTETETALAPVTAPVDDDELLDMLGRWSA